MTTIVQCPHPNCGRSTSVTADQIGRVLRCPHCSQTFKAAAQDRPVETATVSALPQAIPVPFATPSNPDQPERIGRFIVRARLGCGAFGTVYRAHDPQLDREVAVKVPLPGSLDGPQRVERFLREARAAAQLRHPHIVPLFEAGGAAPHFYIASAFIEGTTLTDAIGEHRLDFRQAAQVVRHLAEALAYAHGQGIVHRDVKPANVLLDAKGEPHLLDFGLAHRKELAKLTQAGAILGTPAYMAPEQGLFAEEDAEPLPASDQYSLGVALYELLTDRLPFEGPTEVVLALAAQFEPKSPRQVNPQVPRDLETICLKCLAKKPAERYASCQALADDLRRWLDGEPVAARRLGWGERTVRWCRRNPAVAGLTAAVAAALLLGTVVATYFAVQSGIHESEALGLAKTAKANEERANEQKDRADRKAREAVNSAKDAAKSARDANDEKDRGRWNLYVARMQLAHHDWRDASISRMLDSLNAERPHRGQEDIRGFEWDYLWRLCHRDLLTCKGHTGSVRSVAFSPDGKRILSGSWGWTVKVWDAATGQEALSLKGHTSSVTSVAFSPDSKRIVSGSEDRTVKVWDAATGQEALSLKGHTDTVTSVAFSPDGKRLVSGSADLTVKVWDAATGQEALSLKGHSSSVSSVAFSPDGKRLVSGSGDHTVKVWDATTGQELLTLKGHKWPVTSVAFSPDGKRLVSGGWDTTVKVWDAVTGQETLTLKGHTGVVTSVAFSPDGKRLVSGSYDQTVKVWDAATGQEALSLKGHASLVLSVAFSPDGKRIVSGSADRTVKVWDAATGQETLTLKGHTDRVLSVAFSPDGKRIVSGSWDATVKVWDGRPLP